MENCGDYFIPYADAAERSDTLERNVVLLSSSVEKSEKKIVCPIGLKNIFP